MTYVAVMLGIATWQGPFTLMATSGLGLAILSHIGALRRWQQGRTQLVLVGLAWVTYLVSLCTPCTTGPFSVFGGHAAWIYLMVPVAAFFGEEWNFEPKGWPWLVSINAANLLQLILPLHLWRLNRGRGELLCSLNFLAMIGPWVTLIIATDLFVGYYIWCASFMLLVIAAPVNRWTLVGMAGLATMHIAVFRVFAVAF